MMNSTTATPMAATPTVAPMEPETPAGAADISADLLDLLNQSMPNGIAPGAGMDPAGMPEDIAESQSGPKMPPAQADPGYSSDMPPNAATPGAPMSPPQSGGEMGYNDKPAMDQALTIQDLVEALDADVNGQVSLEELLAKLDQNGDSAVSADEFLDYVTNELARKKMADPYAEQDPSAMPPGMMPDDMPGMAAGPDDMSMGGTKTRAKSSSADLNGDGAIDVDELAQFLDVNGDGKVSDEELKSELDTDRDGVVTEDELYAYLDEAVAPQAEMGGAMPEMPEEADMTASPQQYASALLDQEATKQQTRESLADEADKMGSPQTEMASVQDYAEPTVAAADDASSPFDVFDSDNDGSMSREEFDAFLETALQPVT